MQRCMPDVAASLPASGLFSCGREAGRGRARDKVKDGRVRRRLPDRDYRATIHPGLNNSRRSRSVVRLRSRLYNERAGQRPKGSRPAPGEVTEWPKVLAC